MTTEVDAGRNRDARAFEYVATKSFTVGAKWRAVGIDEEPAVGHHGNAETQLAQRRNQNIAPRPKCLPALLEDRERVRPEAGERCPLRQRRRRNVEVLGELLQVANVLFRRNDPP